MLTIKIKVRNIESARQNIETIKFILSFLYLNNLLYNYYL